MRIRLWIPAKFQTKIQMRILARIQKRIDAGFGASAAMNRHRILDSDELARELPREL